MPEVLQEFLNSLDSIDSNQIWKWLDSNPLAVEEMIAVVADRFEQAREQGD